MSNRFNNLNIKSTGDTSNPQFSITDNITDGLNISVNSFGEVAFDYFGTSTGGRKVVIGRGASSDSTSDQSVAIGHQAFTQFDSVAIGYDAVASGSSNVAIGLDAQAIGAAQSVAVGANSMASGQRSIAIGLNAQATYFDSYAFGRNTVASGNGSIIMGHTSSGTLTNNLTNSFALGWDNGGVLSYFLSRDETSYLNGNGNIAIGRTTASQKLHVNGTVRIDGQRADSGADTLQLYNSGNTPNFIFEDGGAVVFNESSLIDGDFRVEGNAEVNLFFTDASADFVGIGTNAPSARLHILSDGSINSTDAFYVQDSSLNPLLLIEDGGNIGIGTGIPAAKVDISNASTPSTLSVTQIYAGSPISNMIAMPINIGGSGGTNSTKAFNVNLNVPNSNETTVFDLINTSTAPTNWGTSSRVSGVGNFNYGGLYGAVNGIVGNIGIVGVAGSISVTAPSDNIGVVAEIQGNFNLGKALFISQKSTTSGTAYGAVLSDSTGGNNSSTHYGHHITMSQAVKDNIGLYLDVYGATGKTQAIITNRGESIFNESGGDYDFRIESGVYSSMFFVDSSTDRIGVGTNTPNTTLDVIGSFATRQNTPAALTSDANDYNLLEYSFLRLNTNQVSGVTVSGLQNGSDGRHLTIINTANNPITFSHQDTNSTTTNRFINGNAGGSKILNRYDIITYIYDVSIGRWIYTGGSV